MTVEGIPLARLLEEYDRQCAVSNEIVAAHSPDYCGPAPGPPRRCGESAVILFYMIEETARHAGHVDAIRELLDGAKGYY